VEADPPRGDADEEEEEEERLPPFRASARKLSSVVSTPRLLSRPHAPPPLLPRLRGCPFASSPELSSPLRLVPNRAPSSLCFLFVENKFRISWGGGSRIKMRLDPTCARKKEKSDFPPPRNPAPGELTRESRTWPFRRRMSSCVAPLWCFEKEDSRFLSRHTRQRACGRGARTMEIGPIRNQNLIFWPLANVL